jgi:hypothetical protein
MVATELFMGEGVLLPLPQFGMFIEGTIMEALFVVGVYALISILVSAVRFTRSDISSTTS